MDTETKIKPKKEVKEMFVAVGVDLAGDERLCIMGIEKLQIPMCYPDLDMVKKMEHVLAQMKKATGHQIKIYRFTKAEEVELPKTIAKASKIFPVK